MVTLEANNFVTFFFWNIFGDWNHNAERQPLEKFKFKYALLQAEEFTEYKITVILEDLKSNDCFNIPAEISLKLANMCLLDKYILVPLNFFLLKTNNF